MKTFNSNTMPITEAGTGRRYDYVQFNRRDVEQLIEMEPDDLLAWMINLFTGFNPPAAQRPDPRADNRIVGMQADTIIVDDPIYERAEAANQAVRAALNPPEGYGVMEIG